MQDQVDGLVEKNLDCAIAELDLDKRKVVLSIKLLRRNREKRSFRKIWI